MLPTTRNRVRLAVRTKRSELIDKMTHSEVVADELGLSELSIFAAGKEGKERNEAYLAEQKEYEDEEFTQELRVFATK